MKPYDTIRDEVILAKWDGVVHQLPRKDYKWFAYKDGKARICLTQQEALDISKMVEKVQVNEDVYKEAYDKHEAQRQDINDAWESELREEYSELNDAEYSIVYNAAWERGHAYGYDEVALRMVSYADLCQAFKKARGV